MSLQSLTDSLRRDYEPQRVASEHFEHARKHAALLREHEDNFLKYLLAAEKPCSPPCFSRVSGCAEHCSCGRQRALQRAREPYRQTAEALRRENLSLWSASRLASELGL